MNIAAFRFLACLVVTLPAAAIFAADEPPHAAIHASKPSVATLSVPAKAQTGIDEQNILSYLDQVISWRHNLTDKELAADNARETVLKDALRLNSRKVLRSSFAFAHTEAALLPTKEASTPAANDQGGDSRHNRLMKLAADADKQVQDLQTQLAAIGNSKHSGAAAQREKLSGELKIARAHQDVLKTFVGIFNSTGSDEADGLQGKINRLAHTVSEDLNDDSVTQASGKTEATPTPAPSATADAAAPASSHEHSDSLLDTGGDIFSLSRKYKEIGDLITHTTELRNANQALIATLRTALQTAMKEGNTLADAAVPADAKSIAAHRHALDALVERYKQLANSAVPLGEVSVLLDATNATLKEWSDQLDQSWNKVIRLFVFRLCVLGFSLLIPFVFLEAARRATLRYVQDIKRQRQLRILRQAIFTFILVVVVLLNFVSEFGSLATYAGFLTAGIAVSLQTVLVSLTAHFFFFGRFGVRAGDRVNIAGVTGDVVQVGMLRIYLMELTGSDVTELRPTGNIVAFPNSVLFNSTAFSKQVSGTTYAWSELTFLLDPESDFTLANKKILEVVDAIYNEYKDTIARQHTALVQSTHLAIKVPAPRSEVRITEAGLTCVVFYPVIVKRSSEIYEKIPSNLIQTFRSEPKLKLILSNPLKITVREKLQPAATVSSPSDAV